MTLQDFDEDVTYFYELHDFCVENDCDFLDEYFDDLDKEVNDDLYEWIRYGDYDWEDVYSALSNVSTGYDFYRKDGQLDYVGCDNTDFETLKNDVREWAIENGIFEQPGEEDGDDEEEYRPSLAPGFEYVDGETVFVGEEDQSVDVSEFDALIAV